MVKLTREQKKRKKKKKLREYRLRRKKRIEKRGEKQRPWEPVKMKMIQVPNLFPDSMPQEERIKVIREVGKKAKSDFNQKYLELDKWFKEYDALYILSFCALYFTSFIEGTDPEAEGKLEFPMHLLEILQALSLCQERQATSKPLLQSAEVLQKQMREISDLMMIRLVDIPESLTTEDEIRSYHLRTEMIANTTAVRNWAYFYQIKKVVLDLGEKVNVEFKSLYGVSAVPFFKLIFQLTEERNDLLNIHLDKVRAFYKKKHYKEVIKTYNQVFPENKPIEGSDIEDIWEAADKKLSNLKGMLIYHSDLKLEHLYSFDIAHALSSLEEAVDKNKLQSLFDKLSLSFGDLKDFNKEHIILDNPVHHKPFIKVSDGTYYCAMWSSVSHVLLDILEELISVDANLRTKYFNDIKSQYLEDKVEEIFRTNFPNAQIFRGSLWGEYENDLLIIIGSFAIVVEDKARLLRPRARRGDPAALFDTLRSLIEEPSEQALNFIDFIKSQKGEVVLNTKDGGTAKFDPTKIKYIIPLGVTFHHIGTISSNLKKLIEAKVVDKKLEELAPSMTFTDLELIFHLLPLEAEKLHYLGRRREFEAHMLYEGDELDLLAFYLENGFNIGDTEYSRELGINITGKSKELDPYFIGTSEGREIKKPELAMTQWWKDLLEIIATKRMDNWIETSYALLSSTIEDQEKFEKMFKELVGKILKGKVEKPHNWVQFLTGPERRRYAIAGYPYTTFDKKLRNNIISQILDSEEAKNSRGSVVIGVNVHQPTYPYTVLAGRLASELFDTLTLE